MDTPDNKKLDLNGAIVPLSELIEKYPMFFIEFQAKYPDVTKWDKYFILDKDLNPPVTLRQFFAEKTYFMEIKKSSLVATGTGKLSDTVFTIKVRKDNKLEKTIYAEKGDITLLVKAVTFCIEQINNDYMDEGEND